MCPSARDAPVAVGNENIGPAPQITLPGLAGVKNSCSWMSPNPPFCASLAPAAGKLWKGTMVRRIRLTRDVSLMGMTGWKFRLKCVWSRSPPPPLKLNCSGTETTLPTGFCVLLASSVGSCAAAGGDA